MGGGLQYHNINLDHLGITVTFNDEGQKFIDLPDLLLECVRMKGVYPEVDTQIGMHHRTKYAIDACR